MRSVPGPSVAFVSVGSNIEPERNIVRALEALQDATRVSSSSTFYRTEPIGRPGQPSFVNGVWRIDTTMGPKRIREALLAPVEQRLGRVRTADKFAPRTIDLDLILYNDLALEDEVLCLPHPDLVRSFVCVPIRELLDGANDLEPALQQRMLRLLPPAIADAEVGEPLHEFATQLREMLI